jgi:hypothetical protein
MHEMLKLSSRNTLEAYQYQIAFQMMKTKYSTHEIIIGNKHLVSFNKNKMYKKKMIFLGSKIKAKKVCIATQVNEPPNYLDI